MREIKKKQLFTEEELVRSQILNSEQQLRRMQAQLHHAEAYQSNTIRNVDSLTMTESLDALNPFIMDFFIDPDTIQIISAKLCFRIRPYRAYSKTVQSNDIQTTSDGGGTTTTTSSGGSLELTSSSGGGTTVTSSDGGATTVTSGSSSITTTGSSSRTTTTEVLARHGGSCVFFDLVTISGYKVPHIHLDGQSGWFTVYQVGSDPAHYHYMDHYHGMNHYHQVSIGNHSHTVTIGNHTHTVQIPSHNHSVTIPDHHHTVPSHSHGIDFGIYEKQPTSPQLNIYLSNNGYDFDTFLGTYTGDGEIEFATRIKGNGWKAIRFEGNELMRVVAYLIVKTDIKVVR